ncbi:AEC family transporter [Sneathiella sp. CAU 1612]|uniref:AEC family transporter n=1 Tax=Sneathiella sedimenti TaxID=2816034 RepID=A0ABS3F4D4_9PROT|nr:AEC family transporter [Sneathiella sedimenti]MBO0333381.1 AEC family transporter [Sneathiella sedimenti]
MAEIAGLVFPLFGLILLGYLTARITKQPAEAMGWLNTFIIYVALPCLFFKLLSKTPIEKLTSWEFITTNVSTTFVIFLIVYAIARLLVKATTPEATIQGLAGAYGNIGYMGPGIALLTFGEAAAVPLALIFCFENVLHFIVAPTMMALSGGKERHVAALLGQIAKKVFLHPFIIATIVGVAAAIIEFTPPTPIERLIDYLAQAAAPCALFAMGVTLALRPLKRVPVELTFIIPFNLVVHPVLMYLSLSWFGDFDPIWVYTAVLLAALPTATNVFVIAQQYGVWVERASATILLTTMLSVLTVTLLLYAMTTGLMPADLFVG